MDFQRETVEFGRSKTIFSGLLNFIYYLWWTFSYFLFIAVNKGQLLQPHPSASPSKKHSREHQLPCKLGPRRRRSVTEQEKVEYVQIATSGRQKCTSCWHAITQRLEGGNLPPPSLGTFASMKPTPVPPSVETSHSWIFSSMSSFILPNLFFCPRDFLHQLTVVISTRPRAPILGI